MLLNHLGKAGSHYYLPTMTGFTAWDSAGRPIAVFTAWVAFDGTVQIKEHQATIPMDLVEPYTTWKAMINRVTVEIKVPCDYDPKATAKKILRDIQTEERKRGTKN